MLVHFVVGLIIATLTSCLGKTELTVDQILENVENAEVSTVIADITYIKTDPILDRKEIRSGKVLFRMNSEDRREAAILFETQIIGRRKEQRLKHYIFSGRWMAEVDHDKKQFIKRELVSPTEQQIDPFEIGNGPIPFPISQSKESVLTKFNVELIDKPEEGALSKLPDDVVGLRLLPKTPSEWEYIDLFYDPKTWLPIGVKTTESDETKRVCRLTNVKLNALTEEEAILLSIQTPDPREWSIDIRPWVE